MVRPGQNPMNTGNNPLSALALTGLTSSATLTLCRRTSCLPEALRLTRVDRPRVAEELLSSLEEPDDDVAAAWATELERRSREVAEGRAQTTSWNAARTEILKELEQRRAPRTAP